MTEQFFGLSDTGKQRQNNEDTFIAQQGKDHRFIIAAVIDGVGGYSGGEIAAEQARLAILKRLDKPGMDIIATLTDCFVQANENILKEKQRLREFDNMSCVATLALVDIANNQFYFAHVGDSRLYLSRDQSLVKISHDQSFVGFMEDSGRITEDAAMNHPRRNEINKALGFESDIRTKHDYIETGQSPFLSGDLLLLCSDGLSDMITSAEITSILTQEIPLQQKGTQLIAAANSHGGKDNITVVLVKNDKVAAQYAAIKGNTAEKKIKDVATPASQPFNSSDDIIKIEKNKSVGRMAVMVLAILCLLFLATSVYLFLQKQKINKLPVTSAVNSVRTVLNPQEIKLQQAISNMKGHLLLLTDTGYKSPLMISKSILVDKDSIVIKTTGNLVVQTDSASPSAAFVLSSTCQNIIFDSVTFKNFRVAILNFNNAIELKNVRFINCRLSIENIMIFGDKKFVNGRYTSLSFRADSVPLNHK